MKKNIKKILSTAVATVMLATPAASLAATVYVGNVGFDLDKISNEANYKQSYQQYLADNFKNVIVDSGIGAIYSLDDKTNNPNTSVDKLPQKEVPADAKVWDGTGKPGQEVQGELKVESVSAINSTQAEVKFSKAVKEVKPANFKVTDKDGKLLFVSKVELDEAKTVATLSFFDAFADKGVYSVETSNVTDVDGNVIATSTDQFGYEKAEVAKVEFTSTIVKEGGKLADIVKVTDKLGRDVTSENIVEFASANTAIIDNSGVAQAGQDGKEVLVTATVKDTTVTAKAVIKVSQSSAKTFVGYTADTTLAADTDAFQKLEADKIYDYVSVSDKAGSAKTLAVYALDQYGKSINKITAFDSVENLTPNVVIVSATDGKITPVSEGTGYVKVKTGAVEQILKINVRAAAKIQDIEVDPAAVEVVEKGIVGKIKLTYKDQFGGNTTGVSGNLTVKSSDTAVATVSKVDANNIDVKGLKAGTANVTLTYKYTVGTEEVVIEKVVPVTVSEKGSFSDYKVEVSETTLYSEDDTKTTDVDETNVDIKIYKLDDKGQKIGVAANTSLKALDKDTDGKDVVVADDADNNRVTISGLNVAFKAAGTQKVQVKVGDVVLETIEFTTINNTPGIANTVVFDNVAIVAGEINAADADAKDINKQLAKIFTLKDKFGDKVTVGASDTLDYEYIITNKDGVTFGGSTNAKTIDTVTKQNASADIVVTSIKYTPDEGTQTANILASPQVVKLSVKDTTAPVITGVEDGDSVAAATGITPTWTVTDVKTAKLSKDGATETDFTKGTKVSDAGEYVLTVTDNAGNATVINFTITE